MIIRSENYLEIYNGCETLRIEAWANGIRVRCVPAGEIPEHTWALDQDIPCGKTTVGDDFVECGDIRCEIYEGRLKFLRLSDKKCLLKEPSYPWALHRRSREMHPLCGNSFSAEVYFKSYEDEKLFGMGQYRDASFNQKHRVLELAPRNSQISVPFLLSSRDYGFFMERPVGGNGLICGQYDQMAHRIDCLHRLLGDLRRFSEGYSEKLCRSYRQAVTSS